MKTLTKNNLSLYIFKNDVNVAMTAEKITVGDSAFADQPATSPHFIILDSNSNDTVLHENVVEPDDWFGHKYTYDGTTWALVADWVDPR